MRPINGTLCLLDRIDGGHNDDERSHVRRGLNFLFAFERDAGAGSGGAGHVRHIRATASPFGCFVLLFDPGGSSTSVGHGAIHARVSASNGAADQGATRRELALQNADFDFLPRRQVVGRSVLEALRAKGRLLTRFWAAAAPDIAKMAQNAPTNALFVMAFLVFLLSPGM